MSIIADKLESNRKRLTELDRIIAKVERRRRSTNDPGIREELTIQIEQCDDEYTRIEAMIAELEEQRIPEKTAEELQKEILEAWETYGHYIDYLPTMAQIEPILHKIDKRQGGTAIFLIPEHRRMYSKWLLKRVQEWTEQPLTRYVSRPLIVNTLERASVLTELSAVFGASTSDASTNGTQAIADTLFESASGDNVVIALELTIRLPKLSFDLFADFLRWFLNDIWKMLTERHTAVAQNRTHLRLVIFLLTDLTLTQLPSGLCLEAPEYICDKCTVIRISPWTEDHVVDWVHKFSKLKKVGFPNETLTNYGLEAHGIGLGVPQPTWAALNDTLHEELIARIEEIKDGKLAAIQV